MLYLFIYFYLYLYLSVGLLISLYYLLCAFHIVSENFSWIPVNVLLLKHDLYRDLVSPVRLRGSLLGGDRQECRWRVSEATHPWGYAPR